MISFRQLDKNENMKNSFICSSKMNKSLRARFTKSLRQRKPSLGFKIVLSVFAKDTQ